MTKVVSDLTKICWQCLTSLHVWGFEPCSTIFLTYVQIACYLMFRPCAEIVSIVCLCSKRFIELYGDLWPPNYVSGNCIGYERTRNLIIWPRIIQIWRHVIGTTMTWRHIRYAIWLAMIVRNSTEWQFNSVNLVQVCVSLDDAKPPADSTT